MTRNDWKAVLGFISAIVLVQVAAVAVAWIETLDRQKGK